MNSFLSQQICQDPLGWHLDVRNREGVHDNPDAQEFMNNTQALRVVNSIAKPPKSENCRGGKQDVHVGQKMMPLLKHPRKGSKK